jgi:hypothetical protein
MNQIVDINQNAPAKRDRLEVVDAVPLLDTSRFEHMQRVATVMARSSLIPDALRMEGTKDAKELLPYEQILSNCFLVVNQAVRWGLDPFAVAQCVSVVHGKLCYEGKLVAAVLQAKMGMDLHHVIVGQGEQTRIYLSDKPITNDIKLLLEPGYRRDDMRLFDGSVAEWKTSGNNSPWSPKNFPRMLVYRGTRDWCRIYEPALMLGVYTDDEMEDMDSSVRSRVARNITPSNVIADPLSDEPIAIAKQRKVGEPVEFDSAEEQSEHVDAETGEITNTNANPGADSFPAAGSDDASPSVQASSTEPEDSAKSSADTGSNEESAVSPSPNTPTLAADSSSSIPEKEIIVLRRFAKDVLNMAAKPETSGELMSKVIRRWSNIELGGLSPEGKEAAKSIHASVKAIMENSTSVESAIEFYSEMLGCEPEELGGAS